MATKKQIMRIVLCLCLCVCMFMLCNNSSEASENSNLMGVTDLSCYDTDGDGLVLAYINIPETVSTNMRSGNADVIGDGVRLRNSPTTTATILELMYNGESVYIDYAPSNANGVGWYRVQRIKTGTWGWVKNIYICPWD